MKLRLPSLLSALFFCSAALAHAELDGSVSRPAAAAVSYAETPWGTAVLFDSRPLMITNPGGGFGGLDASALQGASTSIGSTATGDYRLAEDFTVPAEGWELADVTVYVYQTGSTTASTITGMTLRIWDGNPTLAGSNILFGDTTTNVLTSTTFTEIYRTTSTTLTNSQRPIMSVTAGNLALELPGGTYWVDWAVTGSLPSGPFAPFVTIPGENASGDALQLNVTTGFWALIVDTGSTFNQTLPLTLTGFAGPSDLIFADGFES